jgi:uncharacterized protein YbjT (DUF2867 family)
MDHPCRSGDGSRMQNCQQDPEQPVAVIGATGKTGRRVVDRLTAASRPVRSVSRSAGTRFDWNDPATWARTLAGASAAYITYAPDLAFPGADQTVGDFVDLAVEVGVRRLVLLSGRGEPGARRAELRLENSGADWTIVRCAFFNQNFDEAFVDAVRYGQIALPAGTTREPFVDADDIADVVVASLVDPRHIARVHELTGPRLLTFDDAAAELAAAIGRDVTYQAISGDNFASDLRTAGVPDDEAVSFASLLSEVLDGRNATITDGVERVLGRPPRDFADYARATAATGVWDLDAA